MGFFAKLKEGLSKTRAAFSDKVNNVFKSFSRVDEELFDELEETLIMADIGVDTASYMIDTLRERVKAEKISDPMGVRDALCGIIQDILASNDTAMHLTTTPSVILVIGVNGVGKTTAIGKLASRYRREGKKVLLAAADTFRAAAIDQLGIWAERSGCEMIRHEEGSDPSAVIFDALGAARARGADLVICDTAGRLHNKKNLMAELNKIFRVIDREAPGAAREVLLVLDSTTGQNALLQAEAFAEAAQITGLILTKLDGTAKGGVVISICRQLQVGVKFIGIGEGIEDLEEFDPASFAKALFDDSTGQTAGE
jgi:fused signal recognition particle receptor